MASEVDLRQCVTALGEVTGAFLNARTGLAAPMKYKADLAAFKLMEVVRQHVDAVSGIAMLPKPGSHLVSAWVLLRSAFEVALTAYWLVLDNDWKEREARWLGWVAGEEEYQRKLAGDIRRVAGDRADRFEDDARRLEQRRLAITQLLPKDSRAKRPKIPLMLQECGIDQRYYVAYRVGSQFTHGGPAVCEEIWETGENFIRSKEVSYSNWSHPFQLAGWSIAQPGYATLLRAGAAPESVTELLAAHDRLRATASALERLRAAPDSTTGEP